MWFTSFSYQFAGRYANEFWSKFPVNIMHITLIFQPRYLQRVVTLLASPFLLKLFSKQIQITKWNFRISQNYPHIA